MNEIQAKTCVQFVPRTSEERYISIFSGGGCWSFLGTIGGGQQLSLQKNGCVWHGTAIHELTHAIGYGHMHSHWDRDKYIKMRWENIDPRDWGNFDLMKAAEWNNFGTPYDLLSAMHYSAGGFSKNGKYAIETIDPLEQVNVGGYDILSSGDVIRINRMYGCSY